jgi:hypothetical protein
MEPEAMKRLLESTAEYQSNTVAGKYIKERKHDSIKPQEKSAPPLGAIVWPVM